MLYHGTGADAARTILAGGARDFLFEEIGACALAGEIRAVLLLHAGISSEEPWRLPYYYAMHAEDLSSPWRPALDQLANNREGSDLDYGSFLFTANNTNAYRYTVTNHYRSEFLQIISETLTILRRIGDPFRGDVTGRFPEVERRIKYPSSPVVLELQNIDADRLLSERGNADISVDLELCRMMQEQRGLNAPVAFRVCNVVPADIVAVHDLSAWFHEEIGDGSWQQDEKQVAFIRKSTFDWLRSNRGQHGSKSGCC